MKRCFRLTLLVLALSLAAAAGNYFLADLTQLSEEQVESLRGQGIETTDQLLQKSLTPSARETLAPKVDLTTEELLDFAKDCELMQISSLGPKAVRLLRAGGVDSVRKLADSRPEELLSTLKRINAEKRITPVDPDLELVRYWIETAGGVTVRLSF